MNEKMLQVFLVEDDEECRDSLKNTFPWEQYGYIFSGYAEDGEIALSSLRRAPPDVLITDIGMPFLDGLALGRRVRREMPGVRIIFISEMGSFEFARRAIEIGAEQYLLKPISQAELAKTLTNVKQKMEGERERQNFSLQFHRDAQEYFQFSRRCFFEKLVSGRLPVREIYEEADKLSLDVRAQGYNIVLYSFQSGNDKSLREQEQTQQELEEFFLLCQEFLLFRWSFTAFAVLVKGDAAGICEVTRFCVDNICRRCENICTQNQWYVSTGAPVERLSSLRGCFDEASRNLSYQYLYPEQHIFTKESIAENFPREEEGALDGVDVAPIAPPVIQKFLRAGAENEVRGFVAGCLDGFRPDTLRSALFCQYTVLNFQFAAIGYLKELGIPSKEVTEVSKESRPYQGSGRKKVENHLCLLLSRVIGLRDGASSERYHALVKHAAAYIDQHYREESLSLSMAAREVNVSTSYFSTVFRRNMGKTFVEYLTHRRMEKAKELLRRTDKRVSEIAFDVGYKDPHYFSCLFKKSEGLTPRDYREKRN